MVLRPINAAVSRVKAVRPAASTSAAARTTARPGAARQAARPAAAAPAPAARPAVSQAASPSARAATPPAARPIVPRHVAVPSAEEVATERARLRRHKQFRRVLSSTIGALVVVAAVAVLVATLFFPVLQVTGSSMEPTLEDGDVIVAVKASGFETGDLCAVRLGGNVLLKRAIAGPGDWVNIDQEGNVYVNGELLDEPYVIEKSRGSTDLTYPYQVPDNRIFVMGDHRSISLDSRSSEVGCIPYEQVIGRVVARVWPLTKLAVMG